MSLRDFRTRQRGNKTDAAEKSISVGREYLEILGGNMCHVAGFRH
jgi:hypothetical protein